MPFPAERPRRLRSSERLRRMVRETRLTPDRLIYPLFVVPGEGVRREISSLPGCFHLSVDEAAREAREVEGLGIAGVILFGLPEGKDPQGTQGYADDGVVPRAVRAIRAECRELLVITDVCLCEYTSHGHCGLIEGDGRPTSGDRSRHFRHRAEPAARCGGNGRGRTSR
jgi:porphobilinogen synthase